MTSSETLRPSPDEVFAAVAELTAANQPMSAHEGLDLLKSAGIYSGTLRPTTAQPSMMAVEPTGPWRTTRSGLWLRSDNSVASFTSSMWYDGLSEDITLGFQTVIEAVSGAIGAPSHDERRSDGSRATWWNRSHFDIEFYFFAETPRSRAGTEISVNWSAVNKGHDLEAVTSM